MVAGFATVEPAAAAVCFAATAPDKLSATAAALPGAARPVIVPADKHEEMIVDFLPAVSIAVANCKTDWKFAVEHVLSAAQRNAFAAPAVATSAATGNPASNNSAREFAELLDLPVEYKSAFPIRFAAALKDNFGLESAVAFALRARCCQNGQCCFVAVNYFAADLNFASTDFVKAASRPDLNSGFQHSDYDFHFREMVVR